MDPTRFLSGPPSPPIVRFPPTGPRALDACLGSGFVRGSHVLLGGTPGAGLSTLAMQAAVGATASGQQVLYVATQGGDSDAVRARLRTIAHALGHDAAVPGGVVGNATLSTIAVELVATRYDLVVVDGFGAFGQIGPMAGFLGALRRWACGEIAVLLVQNDEPSDAVPRVVHDMDAYLRMAVLHPDGRRELRTAKNRYGFAGIEHRLRFMGPVLVDV